MGRNGIEENERRKGELYLSGDVRGSNDKNRVPDGELIEW
jgi:hypothetical protein